MKGFTLIEVLITSTVGLIMAILMVTILVGNNGFFNKQNAIINEGLSLNDATAKMDDLIKQSASVAVGYPEISPSYNSGSNILVLKIPSYDAEGNITPDIYDYAIITPDSAKPQILKLLIIPDTLSSRIPQNLVLATILSSIQFKYFDKAGTEVSPNQATSVEANLTVMSKNGAIFSTRSAGMVTKLRNN